MLESGLFKPLINQVSSPVEAAVTHDGVAGRAPVGKIMMEV
jgi:hypothetical protein